MAKRNAKGKQDEGEDKPSANLGDTATRFDLSEDPTAAMRQPLTVLIVLAPLGLLAELYRFMSERKATLLAEEQWGQLGAIVGIDAPMVPIILLALGCLGLHLIKRTPWELPTARTVLMIVGWGVLWAVVRYAMAFTADTVHGGSANLTADPTESMTAIGQCGIAMSGALQEEMVFRGVLLGALCLVVRAFGLTRTWCYLVALPVSAALFSLAHTEVINHYAAAEPLTWSSFMRRFIAGLLYGYVFLRQGLATSTLAHAGYNAAVVFRLGPWL
ncbi:MAG: CPBP family intramembrane metalloprotease [Planctomycetota bacterium]|jgi:membrane protease YdiL (CAAX protease family)|nr:CPBP family intramembrane metalloprotease [Planctomycetota bacterium]